MKKYKVGLVCSSFDLLHAGHIVMLEQAKELCETLVIALNAHPETTRAGKNKPVQSLFERYAQIAAVKYVDKIIPYENEEDLKLLLACLEYDVRILGSDYEGKDYTGKDEEVERGIDVVYLKRRHHLSTSELRTRVYEAEVNKNDSRN